MIEFKVSLPSYYHFNTTLLPLYRVFKVSIYIDFCVNNINNPI